MLVWVLLDTVVESTLKACKTELNHKIEESLV